LTKLRTSSRKRPFHSFQIGVDLTRADPRYEGVPVVIGPVSGGIERDHPRGPGIIHSVEEQELETGGVLGVDREIDSAVTQVGPERVGRTGIDGVVHRGRFKPGRQAGRGL